MSLRAAGIALLAVLAAGCGGPPAVITGCEPVGDLVPDMIGSGLDVLQSNSAVKKFNLIHQLSGNALCRESIQITNFVLDKESRLTTELEVVPHKVRLSTVAESDLGPRLIAGHYFVYSVYWHLE